LQLLRICLDLNAKDQKTISLWLTANSFELEGVTIWMTFVEENNVDIPYNEGLAGFKIITARAVLETTMKRL